MVKFGNGFSKLMSNWTIRKEPMPPKGQSASVDNYFAVDKFSFANSLVLDSNAKMTDIKMGEQF
jgi:hypothetical protein